MPRRASELRHQNERPIFGRRPQDSMRNQLTGSVLQSSVESRVPLLLCSSPSAVAPFRGQASRSARAELTLCFCVCVCVRVIRHCLNPAADLMELREDRWEFPGTSPEFQIILWTSLMERTQTLMLARSMLKCRDCQINAKKMKG